MQTTTAAFVLVALGCARAAPAPTAPASGLRYTVLLASHRSGSCTVESPAPGDFRYTFEFNDRGRGPKLTEHLVVSADGLPRLIEVEGNDYLKAKVSERFTLEGGRASWKSQAEQGGKTVAAPSYYVSFNGAPVETTVFARALLRSPGHKLALLPEGEARLEKLGEVEARARGEARQLTQYQVLGLDFSPLPFWLDDRGELFFQGTEWFGVVRDGWEDAVPALLEAQNAAQTGRNAALARELSHRPSGALAITSVLLFDSAGARTIPSSTVVVEGRTITAVGADGKVAIPAGAEIIDGRGKTLLPGLWDMHVHLSENDGLLHLANGVTSARDLANDLEKVTSLRKRWGDGSALGPRLLLAGFIDGPGPYQAPTKVLASTDAEALAAIDRYANLGYEQIKIYSSVDPGLVPGMVAAAHARGMRVSGHVPAFMRAEEVVRAGFDELQHANFLFLNFLPEVKDTRTPLRFTAVAENAALLDLGSAPVRDFIALLKERHTVLDPTLNAFEGLFTDRPGTVSSVFAPVFDRLPVQVRRNALGGGLPVPEGKDERYRDSFKAMLKLVKLLHDEGITIVAGTDSLAGFVLARELELYVQAGIPPAQVLQLATLGSARVMKHDAQLGSIAPGKLADLVLVAGDPATRISDVRRVEVVVKDGVVFRAAEMDRALGVTP
jgi:imidazolonepropionase-like amidohydrolase